MHWGAGSVGGVGGLSWGMLDNKPWKDTAVTPNNHYGWVKQWKPGRMDYDQMLADAKAAGFTYAVMVTKHHEGFTLWPSEFGDLGTKQTFGRRDIVKEFVAACRKHRLKVGLYDSPPEWWFDRKCKSLSYDKKKVLDMDHRPTKLSPRPRDHDAKRTELVRGQVRKWLTRYGKIDLMWFDGRRGECENREFRTLQPGIVVNMRNGPGGDFGHTENTLPSKRFKGWFETCVTCWPTSDRKVTAACRNRRCQRGRK